MGVTNASLVPRKATLEDVAGALQDGLRDFRASARYGLAFGFFYAAGGWLLVALLWHFRMPYLAYPLAMGFALVAPFAVVGVYAVSDLLERKRALSWPAILSAIRGAAKRDLRWMAIVTGFALVLWMDIAAFLFFAYSGVNGLDADFLNTLLTTPGGWLFLFLGNASGAVIAMAVFSISVISFPLLYDRDVDFVSAMVASARLVTASPFVLAGWCAFIGLGMGLSLLSGFAGLIVVMPVIGHATWHLYRRVMPQAESDRASRD